MISIVVFRFAAETKIKLKIIANSFANKNICFIFASLLLILPYPFRIPVSQLP